MGPKLSTIHPILGITKDDGKKKLAVSKLYDFTKGGTNMLDQKMSKFSTKAKSNKWTRVAFSYLLDTAHVNASTVLQHTLENADTKVDAFELGWALAESLVIPFAMKRSYLGLSKKTQLKLSFWLAATSRLLHNCKVKVHQHQSEEGGAICVSKSQLESQTTRRKRNGCHR